jgi:hypothetical protein
MPRRERIVSTKVSMKVAMVPEDEGTSAAAMKTARREPSGA